MKRLATLALAALAIASGVSGATANAADTPSFRGIPGCTGELIAAEATATPDSTNFLHVVEVPGWIECDTPQFAIVVVDGYAGEITPGAIRDMDPSGRTTFTAVKRIGPDTSVCLLPFLGPEHTYYNKNSISCARLRVTDESATFVPVPPRELGAAIPIRIWDGNVPPDPECPSCW